MYNRFLKWLRNSTKLEKAIVITIIVLAGVAAIFFIETGEETYPPPAPTVTPEPAPVQTPTVITSKIQKIGHLGNGNSFDMVEANGYLYAGQGTEVRVYDTSSESKIAQLDWKDYVFRINTEYLVRALYIDSGYLYIANTKRLVILDISSPSSPVMVSYIEPLTSKSAQLRDVEIKGNYAFLSAPGAGVLVVDISDKKNPVLAAKLKLGGYNRPRRLTTSDNYLYVAMESDNRLDIIDITDPVNPSIRGSWSADSGNSSLSGVAVEGKYAYVAEYHKGVHVVDISDPENPIGVTKLMGINANDIKILDNYAYVSVRYQGFDIIDISNPPDIKIIGKGTGIKGYIEGIFPTSRYTFVAAESKGLVIYDTSDVKEPGLMVTIPVVGGADSVALKDNYLYIGAHNDGVWVVDVSNPAEPREVAFINSGGRNEGVEIQGNYLFAASDWGGLNTIDITDPENPELVVNRYGDNIDGNALPDGDYLYTSIYYPTKSLGVISMSDPKKLVYVSKSAYNTSKSRFAKYGQDYLLAAVAGGSRGLHIFDISEKTNPVPVSVFDSGVAYKDVAISGNTAFALTGSSIVTLDISNAANPVLLNKIDYSGAWSGRSVDIYNNIAYAAGGPTGDIRVFDITDPSNIKLIDTFDLPENAEDIRYSDGKLFVAAGKAGAYILSVPIAD
ncbi:hypothetical protein ANME2D_01273 [Candidatus Methanoperedens nitroreducens]|uniref:LVIVD repeat protein n=1 Tax=Candidatus Methanoperedens nitratireducens TaxID=1392998 RepID=A0A062V8E8_9EURY|nr:beta-propeller domain-containing protein [Candidatus Methanoperedens nitroreducens]KCZ72838.1 hypothetical protein ANME2D_01273 [Candidatus Methanoperedens nitroreducens]MDJ1423231.1 beta-propeller domain-containing protein [Candidatus Methanoperedens sp.]